MTDSKQRQAFIDKGIELLQSGKAETEYILILVGPGHLTLAAHDRNFKVLDTLKALVEDFEEPDQLGLEEARGNK